jgi:hypothetical protein
VPIRRYARLLAGLVLLASVPGCSSGEHVAAVASFSVTPARSRLALGAPLELTYKFDLLPGATLSADYKVFVHLVDASNRMIWNDDHEPAVPTSQWKAGQSVQYTRTKFLPTTGLSPGDVTLVVGLYGDERLPLQGGIAPGADRAYPAAALQLAPESEKIFLIYTSGWHGQEHNDDASLDWTWTERVSTASFRNPEADLVLYLEYDSRPDAFGGKPQQVTVSVGGQRVGAFAADTAVPAIQRIAIPAAVLGTSAMSELKIEVDPVFVPASLPAGGRDERQLGIRVYHAVLERR